MQVVAKGKPFFSPAIANTLLEDYMRQMQQRGLQDSYDLLTEREERDDRRDGRLRFDIELLADRLTGALDWLGADPRTAGLPIGIFGASTGAAAALVTAARRPDRTAGKQRWSPHTGLVGAAPGRGGPHAVGDRCSRAH